MRGFRHCSGHVRGSVCRVGRVRASTSPSRTSTSFPATRIFMQRSVREEREIGGSHGHNQPAQPEHFFSSIFIDKDDYGSKQKFDKLPSKLFGQNVFKLLSLATFCCLFTNIHSEICLLYTSPSPRDATLSRMPSSA